MGRRFWLFVAAVMVIAAAMQLYGISRWPMADDEVPSLVEMGLIDVEARTFSVPMDQIGKLPRANPVWYKSQRFLIDLLPKSEVSYRLPTVLWGILTAGFAFAVAARWRGLWFASAVAIVLLGAQDFIYLTQLDRFYALPLLLLMVTLTCMWAVRPRGLAIAAIVVLTALTVLSHNVTIAVFGLTFAAACAAFVVGAAPFELILRSGASAATAVAIYLLYLRPIVSGWSSTGNPTPVLVSFASHAGIPTLALAALGTCVALVRRADRGAMIWWALMLAGSLCAFLVASISWNPRYFLFFFPAMWVLAAFGMEFVAASIGFGVLSLAWYACVAALLAPALVSHYVDGSRHDYRTAAAVVMRADTAGSPILSDDAETISYYLPLEFRRRLLVRTKVRTFPDSEFFLVARSNAWMPLPEIANRHMVLLAEIYRRRFDEFSHILRVYRIAPSGQL